MVQRPDQRLDRPERSLFYNNFGPGRDTGAMAWARCTTLGRLRRGHLQGLRTGSSTPTTSRMSSPRSTSGLSLLWEDSWLQHLNIGGSVAAGKQDNRVTATTGQVLRTSATFSGGTQSDLGPEFFAFNNNVREFGFRALWDLHLAYYYRQLSLIAEWQSGFETYGPAITKLLPHRQHKSTQPPRAACACRSRAITCRPDTSSRARP